MPELPEVETIRRGLSRLILNKKIVQVNILEEKSFLGSKTGILNTKIINLRRRGKALIFDLDNRNSFLVHLRMTGQLIFCGKERFAGGHPNENFVSELPNKQTRVIFELENGKLFFNDQRKFGFVKTMKTSEIENDDFVSRLGKEPWEMGDEELFQKIHGKNICIKAALLDQRIIAGLGNIYADESLFFAGVRPDRKCSTLSLEEVSKIIDGARKTMEDSLDAGGSTIRNYVKADGTRGDYLELFAKVYGREGKECVKCGRIIRKIRVSGRGTHFCERCQK